MGLFKRKEKAKAVAEPEVKAEVEVGAEQTEPEVAAGQEIEASEAERAETGAAVGSEVEASEPEQSEVVTEPEATSDVAVESGAEQPATAEAAESALASTEVADSPAERRKSWFGREKRPTSGVTEVKGIQDNVVLYMLIEKFQPNLGEYLQGLGINAQVIRQDIEELKLDIMTQEEDLRVVILEQGVGKFTTTNARQDIQDLVGMCSEDSRRITIFTTSGILNGDITKKAVGKTANKIDWQQYMGITSLVKYLRGLNEEFVLTGEPVDETVMLPKLTEDDLLRLMPSEVQLDHSEEHEEAQGLPPEFDQENLFIQVSDRQREVKEREKDGETFDDDLVPPVAVSY